MGSNVFKTILIITTLASFSLGSPQPSKTSGPSKGVKYRKQVSEPELASVSFENKEAVLFPVKSKILCLDPVKCKERQENGVRVKKQLDFGDQEEDEDNEPVPLGDDDKYEGDVSDYEDLDAEESGMDGNGRWKRSLLGRIFGYPDGHYRRHWWPARRRQNHHHHHHRHESFY